MVFLKIDHDPEIIELICDISCAKVQKIETNALLEIGVNMAHTLHPSSVDVFETINSAVVERLSENFNPEMGVSFI